MLDDKVFHISASQFHFCELTKKIARHFFSRRMMFVRTLPKKKRRIERTLLTIPSMTFQNQDPARESGKA